MLREQTFDAGAVKLNYAEGPASGPPLVLIHGLGNRWQVFLSLVPALLQRWHIYALDLRGHGKSGRVPGRYYGEDYARDVAAFLEHIGQPVVLFGHSLGGMIGMWIAAHHAALLRALILGDNLIRPEHLNSSRYYGLFRDIYALQQQRPTLEQFTAALGDIRVALPGQAEGLRVADLPGNDAAYLRWLAYSLLQLDPDAMRMVVDGSAWANWDGERLLRGIQCPALLLQGNPDLGSLMADSDVQLALSSLPCVTHVRFAGLPHTLHLFDVAPVMRTVMYFLETLPRE